MEERKTVSLKKEEFAIKQYVRDFIGKGKASRVKINYTPVGEKIIISTHKPGLVIGRKGENIQALTRTLKTKFKLQNPTLDIEEIREPEFDSQIIADEIAIGLEKLGPIKFKVIAYKTLQRIMNAGALGAEIRLSGKLPSSRAKLWRFTQGYLKKTGESSNVVDIAQSRAETKPGTAGIKVSILSPHAKLKDKIDITEDIVKRIKEDSEKVLKETGKGKTTKKTSKIKK